MKYEKTKDKNIIKQIQMIKSEIHLDKLKAEIRDLQKQIKNMPKPKEKPDQETLDFWNEMLLGENIEYIENQIIKKQDLLNKITNL